MTDPDNTTDRTNPERLLAQVGGVSGLIYSTLPVVTFVAVSGMFSLVPAIVSALAVAVLVLLWRLIRRESTQPAFSGFFGVAVCTVIAYLVGQSKGYFLLGIWMSLVWAVVFAASVVIRRPLVGVMWSWAGVSSTNRNGLKPIVPIISGTAIRAKMSRYMKTPI